MPVSVGGAPNTRRAEILDGLVAIFLAEGFAHFSISDLARQLRCSKSTLYSVAPSKEQIVVAAVRAFFRAATEHVEERVALPDEPGNRITEYLQAIATELEPASDRFIADVEAFKPTSEIYRRNTEAAARRVQQLVGEAQLTHARVDPVFVGIVAGLVMAAIQRGTFARTAGLRDSCAYDALSALLVAAMR
jgi:AcrR family transcriptional regulator